MSWWRRFLGIDDAPAGDAPSGDAAASVTPAGTVLTTDDATDAAREVLVSRLLDAAQVTANAAPNSNTAELLDEAIKHITAAFGVRHACVHFVHEEALHSSTSMSGMQSCPVAEEPETIRPHLGQLEKAAMVQALALGKPALISELEGIDLSELAHHAEFEDGIIIPIAYQGDAFAWINIFVPQQRQFDDVDLGLLRTVGGVLYGAIKKEAFVRAVQRIRSTLETHFSPRVVDKLISDPESLAKQKSERLEVSVLFSDIRGFTALSETLEPDEVAAMVSEHLEAMASIVFQYDGIVDKYIGDSVMAVFGSPYPQGDHPERAVAAALAMMEKQWEIQAQWGPRVMGTLAIGVGINTGVAIVGDVGKSRREFTHLGDSVNLASRLKDVAKPWQVLVNQTTYERIADVTVAEQVEPFQVKGKRDPIIAYDVTAYTGVLVPVAEQSAVA